LKQQWVLICGLGKPMLLFSRAAALDGGLARRHGEFPPLGIGKTSRIGEAKGLQSNTLQGGVSSLLNLNMSKKRACGSGSCDASGSLKWWARG
jgi:hypothetical protein